MGIDDLLETDEWNEEWTMESVVQGMTLDEVVDNLDDLARLENTMPGKVVSIHVPSDLGIKQHLQKQPFFKFQELLQTSMPVKAAQLAQRLLPCLRMV